MPGTRNRPTAPTAIEAGPAGFRRCSNDLAKKTNERSSYFDRVPAQDLERYGGRYNYNGRDTGKEPRNLLWLYGSFPFLCGSV